MIVLRISFYIIIFCITLIYFLPKNELISYFTSDILMQNQIDAKINLENKLLHYVSHDEKIAYQKQPVANIQNISIAPYILYNKIECSQIELQGMAAAFFPAKIAKGMMTYSIINPTKVIININGDFGLAIGYLDITTFTIHLEVTPSTILTNNYAFILNNMKKVDKKYIYEYKL